MAPLLRFFTFLLVSEKEREAMKDERAHYGTVSKYMVGCRYLEIKAHPPTTSGSHGRQAGRQMKYILKFSTGPTIQIFTYWIF